MRFNKLPSKSSSGVGQIDLTLSDMSSRVLRPSAAQRIVAVRSNIARLIVAPICIGLFCVICCSGCAGYHLGNQFLYNSSIRSVNVMMFESDSDRRFLGQRLTEAVVKEVELSTPLTITDPQIADSFIRGRLVRDSKRVVGENVNDEPRTIQVAWMVEVDWVDRAGVPLMQRQLVRISRDANFVPEGGQSIATAQQRVIEQTARDVVSQMQLPW